jgi:outer membrane lipoprotein-sorting protein
VLSDYRKEGSLVLPHKVVTQAAGQELIMTLDNIQENVEIPKDKFELPSEIRALIQKPAQ